MTDDKKPGIRGYGEGTADVVMSVDDVTREAQRLKETVPPEKISSLSNDVPFVKIENLVAGYGEMEILYGFSLSVAKSQSLCLIGPNG